MQLLLLLALSRLAPQLPQLPRAPSAWALLPRAATLGGCTGVAVSALKIGVESLQSLAYNEGLTGLFVLEGPVANTDWGSALGYATIPVLGGVAVGLLRALTPNFDAPPSVDEPMSEWAARGVARAAAAIATLGTGVSLGPEGPAVDLGRGIGVRIFGGDELEAAGVAAGVAAGFSAPISGVAFALETVPSAPGGEPPLALRGALAAAWEIALNLTALAPMEEMPEDESTPQDPQSEPPSGDAESDGAALALRVLAVSIAALCAASTSGALLQGDLALRAPDITAAASPLEAPLYALLGLCCGAIAAALSAAREASVRRAATLDLKGGEARRGVTSRTGAFLTRQAPAGTVC